MSPMSILVADDSPDTREVLAYCLTDLGHEVTTASGGREAISQVQERSFDLVITDMLMPDADGTQVIGASRRHLPNAPIIAMTGGGDYLGVGLLLKVAGALGADEQLIKPFSRAQLLDALERVFSAAPALVA